MRIASGISLLERPAFYVLIFSSLSLLIWVPANFLRLSTYIGEAFEAHHGAMNLQRFQLRWAGLQDEATSPDVDSHPYLYVHHPNLGLYVSWFFHAIGIESIEAQNALSGLAFLAGLWAAWALMCHVTGTRTTALVFLALLCLDYFSAISFAFNIHRAFGYISVFGVILAYSKWLQTGSKSWLSAFALAGLALLGSDYMFYFFTCFLLAIGSFWGLPLPGFSWRARCKGVLVAGLVLGGLFVLRQVQVMTGLGWEQWKRDFLYQALNRLNLDKLYEGDWTSETAEFYKDNHLLNPAFASHVPWRERGKQFVATVGSGVNSYLLGFTALAERRAVRLGAGVLFFLGMSLACLTWKERSRTRPHHALDRFLLVLGGVALVSLAVGSSICTLVLFQGDGRLSYAWVGAVVVSVLTTTFLTYQAMIVIRQGTIREELWQAAFTAARFSTALLLACLAMYAVFPCYFMWWFPFFNLITICVAIWAVTVFAPFILSAKDQGRLGKLLLSLVLIKMALVGIRLNSLPQGLQEYVAAVRGLEGRVVYSNYTPASVSSFTKQYSAALSIDGIRTLAEGRPLAMKDFALFCERQRGLAEQTKPEYFVYFNFPIPLPVPQTTIDMLRRNYPIVYEGDSFVLYDVRSPRTIWSEEATQHIEPEEPAGP